MACNHTNINCGCKDSFLTTPAPCPTPVGCPDPQPCSEVFDAQCIVYIGDPIICNQDTVVATNDTVADALNQVVDYICNNSAACCPTMSVDILATNARQGLELGAAVTNGTPPYTYEWSFEQNLYLGMVTTDPLSNASIDLVIDPQYPYYNGLQSNIYQSHVKLKVTDSTGKMASAYYMAIGVDTPA